MKEIIIFALLGINQIGILLLGSHAGWKDAKRWFKMHPEELLK